MRPGAAYAGTSLLSALVGIGSVALLSRWLSPAAYGVYAVVVVAATLGQTLCFQWLQTAVLRFRPALRDDAGLDAAVRRGFRFAASGAVLLALLAGAAYGSAALPLVVAGLALTLVRGWVGIVQNWNRSLGRVRHFVAIEVLGGPCALAVAALGLRARPGDPLVPVLGAAACGVAAAALAPRFAGPRATGRAVGELWRYGAPLSLVALAFSLLAASDRLLVAAMLGSAPAGGYAVASVLAERCVGMPLLALTLATKPAVFVEYERRGPAAAHQMLARVAEGLMAMSFPAVAVLVFAAERVTALAIGPALAPAAAAVLPWLAVGSLLSSLVALHFALAFQLTRRTGALAGVMGLAALLNVAANLMLLPRYGVIAAAWTTLGGYALATAMAVATGRRRFAVPFPAEAAARTLGACVPLVLLLRAFPAAGTPVLLAAGLLLYLAAAFALDLAGAREWISRGRTPRSAG